MNTYIVRHGSIAAIQYITRPDGRQVRAVYLSSREPPEFDIDSRRFDASELPAAVLAEVDRRFAEVFSVPVERREAIVRAFQPQEITA